jgi:hypothetical protein
LFINGIDELAGKSTCLAVREHVYQLGSRPSEAVKGLPLDGELRLLPGEKVHGAARGTISFGMDLVLSSERTIGGG